MNRFIMEDTQQDYVISMYDTYMDQDATRRDTDAMYCIVASCT